MQEDRIYIMSKLGRKPDGQVSRVRNFDLEMFWREYESIEPRIEETHDEPDEPLNGNMTLNNNLYLGAILSHKSTYSHSLTQETYKVGISKQICILETFLTIVVWGHSHRSDF